MSLPKFSVKSVASILTSLKKEDGNPLVTSEEAKNLYSLNFQNGDSVLTMEEKWFVYEITWLLNKVGYDKTYNYLSADWEKVLGSTNIRKKMLFENPLMAGTREKFLLDMEIYKTKVEVEAGETCKKCGSDSTISISSQMRSADEAATIKVTCLQCGYRWTAQ